MIAEYLDSWYNVYSVIIGLLFLGFIPAVSLASKYQNFITAFDPYVSTYANALLVWAALFTLPSLALTLHYRGNPIVQARRIKIFVRVRSLFIPIFVLMFGLIIVFVPLKLVPTQYQVPVNMAGGYLTLAFYALIAVGTPGLLLYALNPAAKTFFFEFPFGYKEKLRILHQFRERNELTSARFSFLLAEVFGATRQILVAGFPYLDSAGLSETFVDIQIAMRLGADTEKEAVAKFFENTANIPYRIGTLGGTYSNEIFQQIQQVREKLSWSDEIRKKNDIRGAWTNNLIDLLAPYRDWILVGLTSLLVILTLILIVSR